jgi:hypothetical protein
MDGRIRGCSPPLLSGERAERAGRSLRAPGDGVGPFVFLILAGEVIPETSGLRWSRRNRLHVGGRSTPGQMKSSPRSPRSRSTPWLPRRTGRARGVAESVTRVGHVPPAMPVYEEGPAHRNPAPRTPWPGREAPRHGSFAPRRRTRWMYGAERLPGAPCHSTCPGHRPSRGSEITAPVSTSSAPGSGDTARIPSWAGSHRYVDVLESRTATSVVTVHHDRDRRPNAARGLPREPDLGPTETREQAR